MEFPLNCAIILISSMKVSIVLNSHSSFRVLLFSLVQWSKFALIIACLTFFSCPMFLEQASCQNPMGILEMKSNNTFHSRNSCQIPRIPCAFQESRANPECHKEISCSESFFWRTILDSDSRMHVASKSMSHSKNLLMTENDATHSLSMSRFFREQQLFEPHSNCNHGRFLLGRYSGTSFLSPGCTQRCLDLPWLRLAAINGIVRVDPTQNFQFRGMLGLFWGGFLRNWPKLHLCVGKSKKSKRSRFWAH
jgi:hypothetical protein